MQAESNLVDHFNLLNDRVCREVCLSRQTYYRQIPNLTGTNVLPFGEVGTMQCGLFARTGVKLLQTLGPPLDPN